LVWLALLVFGAGLVGSGLGRGAAGSKALAAAALVLNLLSGAGLLLVAFGRLGQGP
jgi:hypothetical protein